MYKYPRKSSNSAAANVIVICLRLPWRHLFLVHSVHQTEATYWGCGWWLEAVAALGSFESPTNSDSGCRRRTPQPYNQHRIHHRSVERIQTTENFAATCGSWHVVSAQSEELTGTAIAGLNASEEGLLTRCKLCMPLRKLHIVRRS